MKKLHEPNPKDLSTTDPVPLPMNSQTQSIEFDCQDTDLDETAYRANTRFSAIEAVGPAIWQGEQVGTYKTRSLAPFNNETDGA